MMDILSPLGSSDGFFEIFQTGLFHGFFFSLPFSIPMLICFRRYLLDGFSLGNYSFAGTLLGHLSFVFCTVEGIRPIIYFWYPFEPLFSLLGLALSIKVATDFFSQRRFVFDGTLGSVEDSSAYAINPWPILPEISWQNLTGFPMPRPLERFLEFLFFAWEKIIGSSFRRFQLIAQTGLPQSVLLTFEKIQNFFKTNLGPSIFSFQFFLMWLNPASASTLNLLFFEHDILWKMSVSPNSPILLFYTLGFISAAVIFSSLALFILSQLAGRSFLWQTTGAKVRPTGVQSVGFNLNWFENFRGFDETLAQKRFKLFNKFFTFLILGCLIQSQLNYSWRLFLQYPIELIHWDFLNSEKIFSPFKKSFGIFGSKNEPTLELPGPAGAVPTRQQPTKLAQVQLAAASAQLEPVNGIKSPPKGIFQKGQLSTTGTEVASASAEGEQPTGPEPTSLAAVVLAPLVRGSDEGSLLLSEPMYMSFAAANEVGSDDDIKYLESQLLSGLLPGATGTFGLGNEPISLAAVAPPSVELMLPTKSSTKLPALAYFGRREFPPYDTSIRNREKNLPVERHLPIERVNSRRALMGRPPLENEERENAIFKYHTFFINQIDRTVEDFKMKLRTPQDLYRAEDDVLALQKLHENYLKQKGRESPYQKSFLSKKGNSRQIARHDRDFFTKSRPVKNTTKGLLKSSYVRDLFDENLQKAAPAYLHDDLLIENILKSNKSFDLSNPTVKKLLGNIQ